MSDIKPTDAKNDLPVVVKLPWQTPDFETLSASRTRNNGMIAPGDDIFSPSPSGS